MIFRCKVSGNTVEFTAQHDIEAMLHHHQYEVVKPVEVKKEVEVPPTKKK